MSSWYNEQRVKQPGSVILSSWLAGREAEKKAKIEQRMFAGAQYNRLTSNWNPLNTSADSEIVTSLRLLRARTRQLVRDNPHAKRAIQIIVNNVVGTGIGLQATVTNARGKLLAPINDQIESAWERWCQKGICHVAGTLSFPDILRLVMGQVVEAGENIVRKVRQPFGGSRVPFALEVLEADRLIDQWQFAKSNDGRAIRMGVEVDEWQRPVRYWFWPTHPGDYQFATFQPSRFESLPADDVLHIYLVERWPQTRGVPWFHAVLKKLNDMNGYTEAEIVAARASANIVGFIKSPEAVAPDDLMGNQRILDTAPGQFQTLLPGEDFIGFNPTRPNAGLEPFMRYMLREMAAGVGVSYESLSRDYSQSNYSSSRLALLDDRDLWRMLQGWMIRNVLQPIYSEWLDAAVLAGEVKIPDYWTNRDKYQAARWKPRGWSWVEPAREVNAYKEAVRNGFMTVSDVIGLTAGGADAEDVFKARRQELDLMADLGLIYDSDPAQVDAKGKGQAAEPAQETEPPAGENAAAAEPDPDAEQLKLLSEEAWILARIAADDLQARRPAEVFDAQFRADFADLLGVSEERAEVWCAKLRAAEAPGMATIARLMLASLEGE